MAKRAIEPRMNRTLRHLLLLLMGLVIVLPLVSFLLNAFARQWFFPQFIPLTWTLDAWQRLFSIRSDFWTALSNSLLIAVTVTTVSLVIGLPAARVMGLHHFRGKRLLEFFILLPTVVPPLAVSMGLTVNFLRWGLAGNWIGVSIVHLVPVLPYVILTLAGIFSNYNIDYEAQARSLGASPLAVFRLITLPAIFPGLVVAALFAFLISWSQYILTLLVGSGRVITLPLLLFSSASGGNNAVIAAQALLFIVPTLIILLLTSRFLSGSGITGLGRL